MPSAAGDRALTPQPRVGVLALQGDFAMHAAALEALGCAVTRVTLPGHLAGLQALIMPGGESSTMLRLLDATGLALPLAGVSRALPVLGTCAGAILLSRHADQLPAPTLGVLDVDTRRNAYGRQVHSFVDTVEFLPLHSTLHGVFIRAPRFSRIGDVDVIARHAGEPVGVRSGRAVALTFHPELTGDRSVHRWFLTEVAGLPLALPADARGAEAR